MNGINELLSSEPLERLGWTLLHSLWQGAVVAGLFGILLLLIPRSKTNARYVAGCLSLIAIAGLCVITFRTVRTSAPAGVSPRVAVEPVAHLSEPSPVRIDVPRPITLPDSAPPPVAVSMPSEAAAPPVALPDPIPAEPWRQRIARFSQTDVVPLLPWLSVLWLLGVSALSLWHVGGLIAMYRLRTLATSPVCEEISALARRIAEHLRVSRPVRVLQSAIIRTPAVIGHLRPVVLLPVSAITGLSAEQLETILAHELAHIRRYDYLVNVAQTIVETLFFHHPAVWWISRRIRMEREFCCDDLAVSLGKGRLVYARALAMLAPQADSAPSVAAAATGGSLLVRIRRLAGAGSEEHVGRGRSGAGLVLVAVLVLTVACVGRHMLAGSASAEAGNHADARTVESQPSTAPAGSSKSGLRERTNQPVTTADAESEDISGVVRLPDGKLAIGAEVVLLLPDYEAWFGNGKFQREIRRRDEKKAEGIYKKTDKDGRFSFPMELGGYAVIVMHEAGYAEALMSQVANGSPIVLQPHGRVSGAAFVLSKPSEEPLRVSLIARRALGSLSLRGSTADVHLEYDVRADENGRFAFGRVPPGEYWLQRVTSWTVTGNSYTVRVLSGKPVEVTLLSRVVGRIVAPLSSGLKLTPENTQIDVWADVPYPAWSGPMEQLNELARRHDEFKKSKEYQVYTRGGVPIGPDGTFRIDELPMAKYTLQVQVTGPTKGGDKEAPIVGRLTHTFGVEAGVDTRAPQPVDLGTLSVEPVNVPPMSRGISVNGVQLGAAATEEVQNRNGPVRIRYKLENLGKETIRFYGGPSSEVLAAFRAWAGGSIDVIGPDGKPVPLTDSAPFPSPGIDIAPGQSHTGELKLADYFDFDKPGEYRVKLTLRPHPASDPKGGKGFEVSSGEFRFWLNGEPDSRKPATAPAGNQPSSASSDATNKAAMTAPSVGNAQGDRELLRTVASAHRANKERIRTWQGQAHMARRYRTGPSVRHDVVKDITFVADRTRDMARWHTSYGWAPAEPGGKPKPLQEESGMLKDSLYYRFGPIEVADPGANRTLYLKEPKEAFLERGMNAFDPRWYLEAKGEDVEGRVLFYYERWGKAGPVSVTREGNVVTMQLGLDNDDVVNRYRFDLSEGGNAVGYHGHDPTVTEEWNCEYQQIDGIWVPQRLAYKNTKRGGEGAPDDIAEDTIEFSGHKLNQTLDDKEFTFERMGFRPGDRMTDPPKPDDESGWGEAVDGYQVHLWPEGQVFQADQIDDRTWLYDVRRRGTKDLRIATQSGAMYRTLIVDGEQYAIFPQEAAGEFTLPQPEASGGARFDLSVKHPWRSLKHKDQALKLTPGKHTVRLVLAARDPEHKEKLVPVTSNAVEVEIVSPPEKPATGPASGAEVGLVLPDQEVWLAQGRVTDANSQPMAGVEIVAHCGTGRLQVTGRTMTGPDGRYTLGFGPAEWTRTSIGEWQPAKVSAHKEGFEENNGASQGDLFMARAPLKGNHVGLPPEKMILPDRPYTVDFVMRAVPTDPSAEAAPWGTAQDGVQVRIRPTQRTWRAGQTPVFQADVRNSGSFDLHLPESGTYCQVEVDGQWYHWDADGSLTREATEKAGGGSIAIATHGTKLLPFAPGQLHRDLSVTLSDGWQVVKADELEQLERGTWGNGFADMGRARRPRMVLSPGKHTIRIAYTSPSANVYVRDELSKTGRLTVRAVSNPVEIEILPGPATQPTWGEAVEDVQCRLEADKPVWSSKEVPTFRAAVRNNGTRDLSVARAQELCELEIDGVWYRWQGDIAIKSSWLPPGRSYEGIPVSLKPAWHARQNDPPLRVSAGRHTVRVAFIASPASNDKGQPVRAISNAVEIEVTAAEGASATTQPAATRPAATQSAAPTHATKSRLAAGSRPKPFAWPKGDCSLDAKLRRADGKPVGEVAVVVWRKATAQELARIKAERLDAIWWGDMSPRWWVYYWRDEQTGTIWIPSEPQFIDKPTAMVADELPPGDYRVMAASWLRDPTPVGISGVVHLGAQQKRGTAGVELRAARQVTVKIVRAQDGTPLDYPLWILCRADGLPLGFTQHGASQYYVAEDGAFRYSALPPGKYIIHVRREPHFYGEPLYKTPDAGVPLEVKPDGPDELKVSVDSFELTPEELHERWPCIVEGRVTDPSGKPVPGVQVHAHCGIATMYPAGSAATGPDGRYTLHLGMWDHIPTDITAGKEGYTEQDGSNHGRLFIAKVPLSKNDVLGASPEKTIVPDKPYRLDFVMVPTLKQPEQPESPKQPKQPEQPATQPAAGKPTTRVGTASFEGKLELDKIIPILLNGGAGDQPNILQLVWITFKKTDDQIAADVRGTMLSWPKSKWRVSAQLLDDAGQELNGQQAVFENSGIIKGIAMIMEGDLHLGFGPWAELSKASRFRVTIEPAPADAKATSALAALPRSPGTPKGDRSLDVVALGPDGKSANVTLTLWRKVDAPAEPEPLLVLRDRPVYWKAGGQTWEPCLHTGAGTITELPAGVYRVSVVSGQLGISDDPTPIAWSESIDLTGRHISGEATIQLKGDCKLVVKVFNWGTGRWADRESILLTTADGLPIANGPGGFRMCTNEQGVARFAHLSPGQYRLLVGPRDWWYALHPESARVMDVTVKAGQENQVTVSYARSLPAVEDALPWGKPIEGVSCRLRAEQRTWKAGQTPELLADIRNRGTRNLGLGKAQNYGELELDGAWYVWAGPRLGLPPALLLPGQAQYGISFSLTTEWQARDGGKPLEAKPGRHTVRVALGPGPVQLNPPGEKGPEDKRPDLRVVSNPVEIEVVEQAEAHATTQPETKMDKRENALVSHAQITPAALLERLRAEDKAFCNDAELIVEQLGLQTVMVPGGAWQAPENRRLEISLWGDSWAVRARQLDEAPPAYTDRAGPMDYSDGNLTVWRHAYTGLLNEPGSYRRITRHVGWKVPKEGAAEKFSVDSKNSIVEFYPQLPYRPDPVLLPLLGAGRGYSPLITEITSVAPADGGLLAVEAKGIYSSSASGTWHLLVDPNARYMVRAAKYEVPDHVFLDLKSTGLRKVGSTFLPDTAPWPVMPAGATMKFIDWKPRHNNPVLDELRREAQGPFAEGTIILDMRWDSAADSYQHRVEADQETMSAIDDGARATYMQRLSSPDSKVKTREVAAKALGDLKGAAAVEALIKALKDEDVGARSEAVRALGRIGDPQAVGPLTETYRDRKYESFKDALTALGDIGGAQATAVLVEALRDEDEYARALAANALQKRNWTPADRRDKIRLLLALNKWDEAVAAGPAAEPASTRANQAEGPFELNTPIVIPLKLGDENRPRALGYPVLSFSTVNGRLQAILDVKFSSWPRTKWLISIEALDKAGNTLGHASATHTTSGTIEKVPLQEPEKIPALFPPDVPPDKVARFRFAIQSVATDQGNPLVLDKDLPLKLELSTIENSRTAEATSVRFERKENRLLAHAHISYLSWPKAKWRTRVEVHGADGAELARAEQVVESSGDIIGVPVRSRETLHLDLAERILLSEHVRYTVWLERVAG